MKVSACSSMIQGGGKRRGARCDTHPAPSNQPCRSTNGRLLRFWFWFHHVMVMMMVVMVMDGWHRVLLFLRKGRNGEAKRNERRQDNSELLHGISPGSRQLVWIIVVQMNPR
jgi:hypothetical protein